MFFHAGTVETPSTAPMTPRGESEPANGENKPPQAIVKPHVLTHVIEGFVIQEGAEPFPVSTIYPELKQIWSNQNRLTWNKLHVNFPRKPAV